MSATSLFLYLDGARYYFIALRRMPPSLANIRSVLNISRPRIVSPAFTYVSSSSASKSRAGTKTAGVAELIEDLNLAPGYDGMAWYDNISGKEAGYGIHNNGLPEDDLSYTGHLRVEEEPRTTTQSQDDERDGLHGTTFEPIDTNNASQDFGCFSY